MSDTALAIFGVTCIGACAFLLTDCVGGSGQVRSGRVTDRYHVPARTEHHTHTDKDGRTSHSTTRHSEEFHVGVMVNQYGHADIETSRATWAACKEGALVEVKSTEGRITGWNYGWRIISTNPAVER